ncbi:HEAT repeat domain-containing protein [Streptomyces sp. NPDC047315]|uniref:HEAT repeat domain-containing protein n=1 Tax=Streptomyces sp. NPDC047315 TaxID=3155142 RepID=UPI0033D52E56
MDPGEYTPFGGEHAAVARYIDGLSVDELAAHFERSMTARIGTFAHRAALRLGASGDPAGVDAALRILTPPYPRWSSHAAVLLGLARAERGVPALVGCLSDPALPAWHQAPPRLDAVTALARIGSPEAVDALVAAAQAQVAAEDPHGDECLYLQRLVQGLCAVGTARTVDVTLALTGVMGELWDTPTTRALAQRADRRFVPFLVELLAGPRRPEGLLGLERVATARAVPALIQVLQTADDRALRYSATRALATAGEHAYQELSPGAYRNRQAGTAQRRAVAWILGQVDVATWQLTRHAAHLLADRDSGVRARAAASVGLVGDPACVPLLLDVLGDPCHRVRARAATALGRIGSRDARRRLKDVARRDPVRCVRNAADAALRALERPRRPGPGGPGGDPPHVRAPGGG